ncbi:MAG TPA: hypothetical protein VGJ91_18745, partial [Polyangiaceae bacterium]
MSKQAWILSFALLACGSGQANDGGHQAANKPPAGPMCSPQAATESACSGGVDDDCDGYVDCLDSECDGQACADGLSCSGGACRKPCASGQSCVPELPTIQNVRVTTHGDTALIEFEPIAGALDYRIYPEPDPADWLIGSSGEVGVKDGIYRCAGDRVFQAREADDANGFDCSITGCDNARHNYSRSEAEATLGYVFLTPGADRVPVYRVADPNGAGGFRNADWVVPLYSE